MYGNILCTTTVSIYDIPTVRWFKNRKANQKMPGFQKKKLGFPKKAGFFLKKVGFSKKKLGFQKKLDFQRKTGY